MFKTNLLLFQDMPDPGVMVDGKAAGADREVVGVGDEERGEEEEVDGGNHGRKLQIRQQKCGTFSNTFVMS